jgi:flagellar assembly factor FliW
MTMTIPANATPGIIRMKTTRFDVLEIDEDLVITLPEGLIGFEDCTRFVVLNPGNSSLKWLQSLDDGATAFPIADPWQFKPDYAPILSDSDAAFLELTGETPKLVFVIVTVPRDNPRAMTANLLGPVVINPLTRRGKQVILADDRYTTRHGILDELRRLKDPVSK